MGSTPILSKKALNAVKKWSEPEVDSEKVEKTFEAYHRYVFRKWIFMVVCVVIIVIVSGYTITIGSYDIKFFECYQIIWDHITGNIPQTDEGKLKDYIVVTLRSPRIVVAVIAGAGLAVAGVVMQSTLLNPLADAYTTGISSGASFGATLAIVLGATIATGQYAIVINAFAFSLIPMAVIMIISKIKHTSPTMMIMAGIAVMYIFNAATTVLMLMANPNDLQAVYEWTVGSVSKASWDEIPIMLVITFIGIILMQFFSRKLNVLATGEDTANALGVNASQLRLIILLIISMVAAAVVSFTGILGFVGLVSPHIARIFVGADNRYLIPASATLGATILVVADYVGRIIIPPSTLPAGVIMAFMGGPVFLWLIMRRNSKIWS